MSRSAWSWRRQRALLLAASDICHICGQPGADSVDHVIPLARGGTDARSNTRPAHMQCNRAKSDRDYAAIVRRYGSLT